MRELGERWIWRSTVLLSCSMLLGAAACSGGSRGEASDTAGAAVNVGARPSVPDSALHMMVYKSPTCGCCAAWVDHVKQAGFQVTVIDTANLEPVKQRAGILPGQGSCHTAFVSGYTIEGHVPAEDIRRLLAERPRVAGLAVPGMPVGSPGMEGPLRQAYEVIAFTRDGNTRVWARH